jgi:hypothetical protein
MFTVEITNTIAHGDSEEDELIILVDPGSSGDDFLTTSYSHEDWEDDTQSDIDSYL